MRDRDWVGRWQALLPGWFLFGALVAVGLAAACLDTASKFTATIWLSGMAAPAFWWMGRDTYRNVRSAWRGEKPSA